MQGVTCVPVKFTVATTCHSVLVKVRTVVQQMLSLPNQGCIMHYQTLCHVTVSLESGSLHSSSRQSHATEETFWVTLLHMQYVSTNIVCHTMYVHSAPHLCKRDQPNPFYSPSYVPHHLQCYYMWIGCINRQHCPRLEVCHLTVCHSSWPYKCTVYQTQLVASIHQQCGEWCGCSSWEGPSLFVYQPFGS